MQLEQDNARDLTGLIGMNDRNLAVIEQELNVSVLIHGDEIRVHGDEDSCALAEKCIRSMMELLRRGEAPDPSRVRYLISLVREGKEDRIFEMFEDTVALNYRGRPVKCRTLGQMEYIRSVRKNPLTLAVGPAGTGKTFLAVAMAANALKNREVERIILTRPAVEAGEKLGYLPGDMVQKVDPFLRPLYDALFEMMGPDASQRLTERGVLEIAPLAFMRGRTLGSAFIILDEAQNTTIAQMKMFLTRMGPHSKAIITGDTSQVDLAKGQTSGLEHAMKILKGIRGIAQVEFTATDVLRHHLVKDILLAYAQKDKKK